MNSDTNLVAEYSWQYSYWCFFKVSFSEVISLSRVDKFVIYKQQIQKLSSTEQNKQTKEHILFLSFIAAQSTKIVYVEAVSLDQSII